MPFDSSLALNLASQINAAFAEAHANAAVATTNARLAVSRALECGELLNRQKESLAHGEWQLWLAEHCPNVSGATARRYMRLAKRSHDHSLEDAGGLRQAYLATGVLPESPRTRREPNANTPTVTFVRGLDLFRRWFHQRTDELPLEQWTPDARRILRNELTWFKKLYDRLAE